MNIAAESNYFLESNMKILATDLDRTLLPNGSWKADDEAIDLFTAGKLMMKPSICSIP